MSKIYKPLDPSFASPPFLPTAPDLEAIPEDERPFDPPIEEPVLTGRDRALHRAIAQNHWAWPEGLRIFGGS